MLGSLRLMMNMAAVTAAIFVVQSTALCQAIPGDIDDDGDVDGIELQALNACAKGPGRPHNGFDICKMVDSTRDNHVDLRDVANLQRCFSGDGILASSDCTIRPIEEGLMGQCVGGNAPDPTQTPGDDLHKVVINLPRAVCNDGSPAVMYIRAASDVADQHRWIIYLEGGGGCGSGVDCMKRWCGNSAVYTAAKMSSNWAYDAIEGQGIFNADVVANPVFSTWNHVYMYYCSSDAWSGRAANVVLTNEQMPSQSFQVHFKGHDIFSAAVEMLKDGQVTSADKEETLPSLDDATEVVLSGTSAGSAGVRNNADWFRGQFNSNQTTVVAVCDAAFMLSSAMLSDPNDFEEAFQEIAEVDGLDTRRSFVDATCESYYYGTGELWRCMDMTYLAMNHMSTPFFVRMDITDSNAVNNWTTYGLTPTSFASGIRDTFSLLPDVPSTSQVSGSISRAPGGYGPNCSQHVALTTNKFFLQSTIDDSSGTPRTFEQALREWLVGNDVLLIDDHPAVSSVCP